MDGHISFGQHTFYLLTYSFIMFSSVEILNIFIYLYSVKAISDYVFKKIYNKN